MKHSVYIDGVVASMLDNVSRPFKYNSETQRLRIKLAESARSLDIMMRLAAIASEMQDFDEFLAETMQLLCEFQNTGLGVAWILNPAEQKLSYRLHVDVQRIQTADFIDVLKARRIQAGESLPGLVWNEGIPMSSPVADFGDEVSRKSVSKAGFKSAFAMPLRSKYGVVGVLEFFSRKRMRFNVERMQFLGELGTYIGTLVEQKCSAARLMALQAEQEGMQQQLREVADQALESARVKSEFVANVSHEVRTPLAGILGMAEMLASKEGADEETKDLASYILGSAHSLLVIVNDLLDFSKLEAGKLVLYKTWFSLRDLVESVAKSARIGAEKKGIIVRTRIDDRLPDELLGDSARLTQIMMNFAHNAVKFTERGEILISAEFDSAFGNTIRIRLAVCDTGIGISQEAQKRLFQPFVQAESSTARRFGGTGLGLSIARKLTELMDGEIGLDSEENVGSSFFVILPLERAVEEMAG